MSKKKLKINFACLFIALMASSCLKAQAITYPGLSQNNYKMPGKAEKVKVYENEKHFVAAMSALPNRAVFHEAKYSESPSSIVITLHGKKQVMNINPLLSTSNYKTQTILNAQPTHEVFAASLR